MSDRPSTTAGVVAALRPRLAPAAGEAGFVLAHASPPGVAPKADIGMLEYCADRGGRRLWLGFYEDPGGRAVVAELWAPDRLRGDPAGLSVDAVAERRLTWHRAPGTPPEVLADTVAAEVMAWLAARARRPEPIGGVARGGQRPPPAGEGGALRLRLRYRLEALQRRLATYATFDEPEAVETADRIAAVALALDELDTVAQEGAPAKTG